ncbi:MAG: hypothetical protein AB1716_23910 [Planctomycetota bacterium]
MATLRFVSWLFYVAGIYDGLLGLAFLLFPLATFGWFEVPPPNHLGYVQFPAAILIVFGLMFVNVARRPVQNRNLIPYGILLKLCYSAVVIAYWFSQGLPNMWKPFAVLDAGFAVLFAWAYLALGAYSAIQQPRTASAAVSGGP